MAFDSSWHSGLWLKIVNTDTISIDVHINTPFGSCQQHNVVNTSVTQPVNSTLSSVLCLIEATHQHYYSALLHTTCSLQQWAHVTCMTLLCCCGDVSWALKLLEMLHARNQPLCAFVSLTELLTTQGAVLARVGSGPTWSWSSSPVGPKSPQPQSLQHWFLSASLMSEDMPTVVISVWQTFTMV